jgi:deoxyribonuclease-4
MKYVGAHVSISGGVENAPLNATAIGAKAFAMFTKNQRQWSAPPLTKTSIDSFKKNLLTSGISPQHILPHDSYLINLGNADDEKRAKSLDAFLDEAARCQQLGLKLLNFHPGSHLNEISLEESMKLISHGVNQAIENTTDLIFVFENTAGQGSNLGNKFEELAYMISLIREKDRVGVCLDTCHTYSSGYDIKTIDAFQATMKKFDQIIGAQYLKAMHLNDSKTEFNSKKDRHHSLGAGTLGIEPFKWIMEQKRFDNIPLILETIDETIWEQEIKLLYSFT